MKIIFLDVDGILTYINSGNQNEGIDESRVERLKEIIDYSNAKIVVISSWKGYTIKDGSYYRPKCYNILKSVLNKYGLEIYDDTEYINLEYIKKLPLKATFSIEEFNKLNFEEYLDPMTTRAAEVYNWLKKHQDIESFVILDDEDHMWKYFGYDKYWIQPSWYQEDGGLQQEHVKKAIKILNKKDDEI